MTKYVECPNCGKESMEEIFDKIPFIDITRQITMLEAYIAIHPKEFKCKKCGAPLKIMEDESV